MRHMPSRLHHSVLIGPILTGDLVTPKSTGFCFLDVAQRTGFKPPDELEEFLAAGPPPVYFGWGSLVVDDPKVCRCSTTLLFTPEPEQQHDRVSTASTCQCDTY